MTDPARALLGRVKELDEKATDGPWEYCAPAPKAPVVYG